MTCSSSAGSMLSAQVEAALLKVEGTLPHYQIVLTRERDWM